VWLRQCGRGRLDGQAYVELLNGRAKFDNQMALKTFVFGVVHNLVRTLISNDDGADHARGEYQIMVGDSNNGRNLFGTYPVLAIDSNDDVGRSHDSNYFCRSICGGVSEVVRRGRCGFTDGCAEYRQLCGAEPKLLYSTIVL
jgi:hypothetical protein